jgi:thymidylate kinase
MSARRELLEAVFKALEQEDVHYCVSRNHATVFEDSSSDVDLLVRASALAAAERVVRAAAAGCGFSCILKTRFANLCLLFWKGPGQFLRIDFETELRWRIFPIQDAATILDHSRHQDHFKIPSPAGEAAIIVTKFAWMGRLSERYRNRLESLMEGGRETIIRESGISRKSFHQVENSQIRELRRVLILTALGSPKQWARMLCYIVRDLKRLLTRTAKPPGILLQTWTAKPFDNKSLGKDLEMAFPSAKTHIASNGGTSHKAFMTIFRGGLLLDMKPRRPDVAFESANFSRCWNRLLGPNRRFRCYAPPHGPAMLMHEGTGMMRICASPESALPDFIGTALSRTMTSAQPCHAGRFVVLVGLDGAGKTTFARGVAEKIGDHPGLHGLRYFHWIPGLTGFGFPLPALAETSRKNAEYGIMAGCASIIRLIKNIVSARISYHLRIRPLVRSGHVVLVDRFVYNYWIDPVSLRYSGPAWCLQLAGHLLPKPDMVLSLEAEPEILLARKQELTREQMETMRQRIRTVPARNGSFHILDASQSPEELVEEFFKLIERQTPSR